MVGIVGIGQCCRGPQESSASVMIHCLWRAFVVEKLWVCLFTRTSPQLFVRDHKLPVHNRYLRPCRKPEPGPAKDLVPPEMATKCQYLPICRETEGRVVHSVRFVSESVFPVACWFCSDTFPVPVWLPENNYIEIFSALPVLVAFRYHVLVSLPSFVWGCFPRENLWTSLFSTFSQFVVMS